MTTYGVPSGRRPARPGGAAGGPGPRRRSAGLLVALVSLVLAGLVLITVAVLRPGPVDGWLGGDRRAPTPVAEDLPVAPSPVLAAVSRDAPAPTAAGVQAALAPLVADGRLGPRVYASVVDVASGQSLYAQGGDTPATPASTTKLVTAVTVLVARGPAYRLPTRAVAGATPGEVVLVGGGDPTLAAGATGAYPGAASLTELAARVRQTGTVPTKVTVDASLFAGPLLGPGWDADIATGGFGAPTTALMTDGARVNAKQVKPPAARYSRPDLAAGQAFAKALGVAPNAVGTGVAPAGSGTPNSAVPAGQPSQAATPAAPGTELGRVESPPIARLVEVMLADSDNVVAEALARQVALAKGEPATYAGAATAMKKVLADLGLPAAQDGLVDGSGLSRADRVTPSLLTDLLTLAARPDRPELHGLFAGLPVAGYSGTLRDRFRSAGPAQPGAGLVRAKTGTLTGVSSISGIAVTREGRLLAFAVLADRVPAVGPAPAADALDTIAAALAACGCR